MVSFQNESQRDIKERSISAKSNHILVILVGITKFASSSIICPMRDDCVSMPRIVFSFFFVHFFKIISLLGGCLCTLHHAYMRFDDYAVFSKNMYCHNDLKCVAYQLDEEQLIKI